MKIESSLPWWSRRLTLILLIAACLTVWGVAFPAARADAGSIRLACWDYDRGNAKVSANPGIYADYRDKGSEFMMTGTGKSPFVVEYDVDFPVTATYTLHVRYASAGVFPLDVMIDDKRVGTCCAKETNNAPPYKDRHPYVHEGLPERTWHMHGAEWEESCKFQVAKGKRRLKFTRNGPPSNLIEIRLDTPEAFPKGYKPIKRKFDLSRIPARHRRIFMTPTRVNVATLRLAIEDKIKDFGPQYPKGPQYLKQLSDLEAKQKAASGGTPEQIQEIEKALAALQRQAMLDHPALKFDKLLFVKRMTRNASVYTGHRAHGSPGGNLCILSPVSQDGKITELVPELAGGVIGRFDLSFDATKVVFCYSNGPEKAKQYRIYEIDIDPATGLRAPGKSLRQLTFDVAKKDEPYGGKVCLDGYNDMDPIYLPNGKIMFASSRSRRSVLCAPQTSTTLHIMDADGKNISCISGGQVNELSP